MKCAVNGNTTKRDSKKRRNIFSTLIQMKYVFGILRLTHQLYLIFDLINQVRFLLIGRKVNELDSLIKTQAQFVSNIK